MDIISLEILEDGTITVKTDEVSDGNHISADKLMADIATLTGGTVTKKNNPEAKRGAHLHSHNGVFHSH